MKSQKPPSRAETALPQAQQKAPATARWFVERRRLLKTMGAGMAASALGPWVVRDAFASSGELRLMIWSDYLPESIIQAFEKETGIRLVLLPYASNEELINKVKASKGRSVDLICPSAPRVFEWRDLGLTKAFDEARLPLDQIRPDLLALSAKDWSWDGGLHHIPLFWSTEGLAWAGDALTQSYPFVSYGDLWREEFRGRVMGEAQGLLTGIGLYLDWIGKVPSNRLLDTYKDENVMRDVWRKIAAFAADHRDWVKLFWKGASAQRAGFLQNGIIIGQTWNGPAMALRNEGHDITFMSPREGAMAWSDGLSLTSGAENIDQAYAFANFVLQADVNGQLASSSGRHPVSIGAEYYLWDATKANFEQAYPYDARESMWWLPPVPLWFAAARARFRDEFVAAG